MKKYTVAYFDDIKKELKLKTGTLFLIKGKTTHLENKAFSKEQTKEWYYELLEKHFEHPALNELHDLFIFLQKNKVDLILF